MCGIHCACNMVSVACALWHEACVAYVLCTTSYGWCMVSMPHGMFGIYCACNTVLWHMLCTVMHEQDSVLRAAGGKCAAVQWNHHKIMIEVARTTDLYKWQKGSEKWEGGGVTGGKTGERRDETPMIPNPIFPVFPEAAGRVHTTKYPGPGWNNGGKWKGVCARCSTSEMEARDDGMLSCSISAHFGASSSSDGRVSRPSDGTDRT